MRIVALLTAALLVSACAGSPPAGDSTAPAAGTAVTPKAETRAEAHRLCYQRMQAARAGALLMTPNWHQVRMCMQARGHPV